MKRRPTTAAAILAAAFFSAAPVLAQEGEGSPVDAPVGWVFRWLNFALVLAGIAWAVRKARPYFRGKSDAIYNAIMESARAREEAEQRRKEAQAKLANVENEIADMRAAAQRESAAEAQRLRELARSDAGKIEHAAQIEIAAAERAARLELKAHGARLAVERAEGLLLQRLTPAAQANLFRGFLHALEGSRN